MWGCDNTVSLPIAFLRLSLEAVCFTSTGLFDRLQLFIETLIFT